MAIRPTAEAFDLFIAVAVNDGDCIMWVEMVDIGGGSGGKGEG